MNLRKHILFLIIPFLFNCCTIAEEKKKSKIDLKKLDSIYTLNPEYDVRDSRRYGIFPNSSMNNSIHDITGKSKMESLMNFASQIDDTIFFKAGLYNLNLLFDSKKNIIFYFNNSGFNLIHITDAKGEMSSNINLLGTLISYDRFGTYNSKDIKVDSLIIKSDSIKNISGLKSRGCYIYKGTKDLFIDYLEVQDLASGNEYYKNNHAALSLDGLGAEPENVTINKAVIKSSDRHGVFINGENNIIKSLEVYAYGLGEIENMSGMQGVQTGEELILSGVWINRCNNCFFDKIKVVTKSNKGIPLKLDEGKIGMPTIINELILDVKYRDSLVLDDILTNVLVKKISISND